MYDAWDSVSVVGTSLFLPQAITTLSFAAGSQSPRALWSFLGSVSTWVSLGAFLAIGPIAEYSDLRVRLMRPCSLAGAAAMVLFLAVQHPSMLWLAAFSVVAMRVANRVAGLVYGALLRDTSAPGGQHGAAAAPAPAGGSPAGRSDEGVAAWPRLANDAPAPADDVAAVSPRPSSESALESEAAAVAAAHELAARGTAVGYVGMLAFALLAGACFLLPGMLVGPTFIRPGVPINATDPASPTFLRIDPLGTTYWLEQLLPIGAIGVFWACGALLVSFPHLAIQRPGPPLPSWVVHGSGCGPRSAGSLASTCGCCCTDGNDSAAARAQKPSEGNACSCRNAARCPGMALRVARFGATTGLADQGQALALTWRMPGRDLLWYLVSWMFLSDAASTATSSAALLVADELGVSSLELAAIAVLGMVTAAGGATGWRLLVRAGVLSGTAALHVAILVLSAILGWVAFMSSRWELYALTVIAGVQLGAIASFTRSLLVSMTPRDEQARIGALYELTQKGTSWIGPLAIGAAVQAMGEEHYRIIVVTTVAVEVAIGWPIFLLCVSERRGSHAAAAFDRAREAERAGAGTLAPGGSDSTTAKPGARGGGTPSLPNEVLSPLVLAAHGAAKRGHHGAGASTNSRIVDGSLGDGPPAPTAPPSLRSKSGAILLSGKQVGDDSGDALLLGDELHDHEVAVEEEPADKAGSDRALLIVFGVMVAVGLCNNILRVLQFGPMHNYALFTNLLTTFVYLPTSWGYVYFNWSKLTDDEKAIPWYKWAIMGGLDSMAGILQSIAVAFVSNGTLVTLLLQSAIPVSMVFTRLFTKKRYKWFNYVGAVAVLIGIAVVLAPKLAQPDSDSTSSGPGGLIVWALVLVASCVPMTLSSVYKELNLGDADCDAWHMNGQVALYQFIASFILLYPSGLIEGLPADGLWQNIWGGFRCLATLNTAANDDCSSAPYLVTAYCVANLGYNVLIIVILKMGGSNLLWLCLTTMVPMASFFFALPFVPVANRSTITPYTGIGLVIILGGLVIYRFYDTAVAFVRRLTGAAPPPEEGATKAIGDYVAMDISIDDGSVNGTGGAPSPVTSSTPVRGVGAMHVPRRKRK